MVHIFFIQCLMKMSNTHSLHNWHNNIDGTAGDNKHKKFDNNDNVFETIDVDAENTKYKTNYNSNKSTTILMMRFLKMDGNDTPVLLAQTIHDFVYHTCWCHSWFPCYNLNVMIHYMIHVFSWLISKPPHGVWLKPIKENNYICIHIYELLIYLAYRIGSIFEPNFTIQDNITWVPCPPFLYTHSSNWNNECWY